MPKSKIISSIDIGSSKVSVLLSQYRPEEPERLHIVGASSSVSRGVRRGQIVNIEEAVASIEEAVGSAERMAGYNIPSAWVSIGGPHIHSQNSHGVVAVSQPQGEIIQEDVKRVLDAARAISLPSASEIIHVIPRTFIVDNQDGVRDPVGMTGVRLEVDTHIILGSSPVIKNLTKCIGEVGCDISGLVFNGLASSTAVLSDTEKELGVILVDIGGGTMSIGIFIEGSLAYSSVIQVGAINVTKDLAAGLRVSLESAEKIKLFLSENKIKDDELDLNPLHLPEELKNISIKTVTEGIIRPRLNEMMQMITDEIKKSGFGGLTPSGLVLTGGGSMTVGIVDIAKKSLGLPVRIGIPSKITGLIDDIQNPSFATAVGLLQYAQKLTSEDFVPSGSLPTFDKGVISGQLSKAVSWFKSLLP